MTFGNRSPVGLPMNGLDINANLNVLGDYANGQAIAMRETKGQIRAPCGPLNLRTAQRRMGKSPFVWMDWKVS
jgi:hypothetical protein